MVIRQSRKASWWSLPIKSSDYCILTQVSSTYLYQWEDEVSSKEFKAVASKSSMYMLASTGGSHRSSMFLFVEGTTVNKVSSWQTQCQWQVWSGFSLILLWRVVSLSNRARTCTISVALSGGTLVNSADTSKEAMVSFASTLMIWAFSTKSLQFWMWCSDNPFKGLSPGEFPPDRASEATQTSCKTVLHQKTEDSIKVQFTRFSCYTVCPRKNIIGLSAWITFKVPTGQSPGEFPPVRASEATQTSCKTVLH